MIPVYLRHQNDLMGSLLCQSSPEDLDLLVETVSRWTTGDALGQFFVTQGRAGFEIVYEDEG